MIMSTSTNDSVAATRPVTTKSGRHTGISNSTAATTSAGEEGLSFPLKLHAMLEDAERKGFAGIVSWQPGNKSFRVHDVHQFGTVVMPQYFNQTKFKSFQRQLNIYGYRRIQHGPLKGGYVHKCFIRGRPELSSGVTRKSNTKAAAASAVAAKVMEVVQIKKTPPNKPDILQVAPHADPNQLLNEVFEEIKQDTDIMNTEELEPIANFAASVDFGSCNLQGVLERIFHAGDVDGTSDTALQQQPTRGHHGHRHLHHNKQQQPPPPPPPQHFRSASGFVFNLTQDDATAGEDADMNALFDMLAGDGQPHAEEQDEAAAAQLHHSSSSSASSTSSEAEAADQESEEQLSERIFPLKLHKMLENARRDGIEHIVSWVNDGTGFKVHNSQLFTQQVMPMWFDQTKYESFRRQLNLYSFSRISRGPQRGVYSHPAFCTGRRDLLGGVVRKIHGQEAKAAAPKGSPSYQQHQPHYGQDPMMQHHNYQPV